MACHIHTHAITRHQRLGVICREWPTVAPFVVNRHEYFMENENIIRTFCGCKLQKIDI